MTRFPSRLALPALSLIAGITLPPFQAQALDISVPGTGLQLQVPTTTLQQQVYRQTVKQQFDFSCGSAALATLLTHHYNDPAQEEEIFRHMWSHGDRARIRNEGFSLLDMKRYLAERGYKADGFRFSLDRLQQLGVPAILLIQEEGYSHFVVIKGLSRDHVLVGDPAKGTRIIPRSRFEKMRRSDIVFLIRNRSSVGRRHFNRNEDWQQVARAPLPLSIPRAPVSETTLFARSTNEF